MRGAPRRTGKSLHSSINLFLCVRLSVPGVRLPLWMCFHTNIGQAAPGQSCLEHTSGRHRDSMHNGSPFSLALNAAHLLESTLFHPLFTPVSSAWAAKEQTKGVLHYIAIGTPNRACGLCLRASVCPGAYGTKRNQTPSIPSRFYD